MACGDGSSGAGSRWALIGTVSIASLVKILGGKRPLPATQILFAGSHKPPRPARSASVKAGGPFAVVRNRASAQTPSIWKVRCRENKRPSSFIVESALLTPQQTSGEALSCKGQATTQWIGLPCRPRVKTLRGSHYGQIRFRFRTVKTLISGPFEWARQAQSPHHPRLLDRFERARQGGNDRP
jgi:hypothetical protein